MRSILVAALVSMLLFSAGPCADFAAAQEKQFPYEAIVEVDGEYVRSGPGPTFYPTDKLKRGDKVMVHRHDPGGWCMVTPPPGSFSWIRAEHVQKSGEDRGVLKANNVVVHIGSNINPEEFTTIQANLSKGDAVQILGEQNFPFDGGQKLMYKISPVKREWRWIPRKALAASNAIRSEPFQDEPAPRPKKPSGPVAENIEIDPDAFAKPISTGPVPKAMIEDVSPAAKPKRNDTGSLAKVEPTDGFRASLDKIDSKFREMIQDEPPTWDLKSIEQQYRALETQASQPSISNTIGLRLDAVARYQKIREEYVDFINSTNVAKQRDAQLASLQKQHEDQLRALGASPSTPAPTPMTPPSKQSPTPLVEAQPVDPNAGRTANTAPNTGATPNTGRPVAPNGFAGAGIVQPLDKSFSGGPQFLLIAPDGRFLAFLIPGQGIDLRQYGGKAMGIIGDRQFRKDWNADTITVRGLQPVQLRAAR